jgi:hypothetical protein
LELFLQVRKIMSPKYLHSNVDDETSHTDTDTDNEQDTNTLETSILTENCMTITTTTKTTITSVMHTIIFDRVLMITPDGTVSTLAGSGSAGLADGASVSAPWGVVVDGEGSIIESVASRRPMSRICWFRNTNVSECFMEDIFVERATFLIV